MMCGSGLYCSQPSYFHKIDLFDDITHVYFLKFNIDDERKSACILKQSSGYDLLFAEYGDAENQQGAGLNE